MSVRNKAQKAPGKARTSTKISPAVKSISRAAAVLNCLGERINILTDIAETCHLSKSTVHRLLRALEESRLAMQSTSNHRYYLGPLITTLASRPETTHEHLVTCSLEEMLRLSEILEETVNICVMPALQHVIVHEIPSRHDLRVTEENRRLGSLYAGAAVKVLLSQLNDEHLKIIMKHINILAYTRFTVTDKDKLLRQIQEVRARGYAVSYGEKIPDAMGLAAPIFNYPCPAALSIIGPEARIKPRIDTFIEEVSTSARKISGNVGDILKI
jgi:IclR family acetate operon transcriptional repressor